MEQKKNWRRGDIFLQCWVLPWLSGERERERAAGLDESNLSCCQCFRRGFDKSSWHRQRRPRVENDVWKKSSSSAAVEANQDILDQCNRYARDSAISRRTTVLHYSNMTLMTNKIKEYFCSIRGQCLSSRLSIGKASPNTQQRSNQVW